MTTHATDRDFANNFDFIYCIGGIKLQVEGTYEDVGRDAHTGSIEYDIGEIQVYQFHDPEQEDISFELERDLFMPIKYPSTKAKSVLDDIMEQALERRDEM